MVSDLDYDMETGEEIIGAEEKATDDIVNEVFK